MKKDNSSNKGLLNVTNFNLFLDFRNRHKLSNPSVHINTKMLAIFIISSTYFITTF